MFPKQIEKFLIKNGFESKGEDEFFNDACEILCHRETHKNKYLVSFEIRFDGGSLYSNDENIYWLIGVLTYYNLMDKNYK